MDISPPCRVFFYGSHAKSWMKALGALSDLWTRLPEVTEVRVIRSAADLPFTADACRGELPVLIPLLEEHIRNRPRGFRELSPTDDMIDLFADKKIFWQFLRANRLSELAPATTDDPRRAVFPAVLKRTGLHGGAGIVLVEDAAALDALLAAPEWQGVDYILQDFEDGLTEHVCHCLCEDGRLLWHRAYAYDLIPDKPIRASGHRIRTVPFEMPGGVLDGLARVLAVARFTGPCNADFKIDFAGRLRILEINPRLGGSLMAPQFHDDLAALIRLIIRHARVQR